MVNLTLIGTNCIKSVQLVAGISLNRRNYQSICLCSDAYPLTNSEDVLSPFLVALFLKVVKRIVSKGLKRSYYNVQENLESKVRGHIQVGKQLQKNIFLGRLTKNYCSFQEYGEDIPENRLIHKALKYCKSLLSGNISNLKLSELRNILNYVMPVFNSVSSEISVHEIRNIKVSPLYIEYSQAVKYAKLILKRFSYNISDTKGDVIMTPPYWIDMTKLFELYVYKKLREVFSSDEVKYHFKAHYRELDYILRSKDGVSTFVIDAKYKPAYHNHAVYIDDLRQVAGYARLEKVYQELKITNYSKNIDCLIIYAHQSCEDNLQLLKEGKTSLKRANGYVNMYVMGISLPEIKDKHIESI